MLQLLWPVWISLTPTASNKVVVSANMNIVATPYACFPGMLKVIVQGFLSLLAIANLQFVEAEGE